MANNVDKYEWCAFPKSGPVKAKVEVVADKPKLKTKTQLKAKKPINKVSKKKSSAKRPKKELCIMPAHSFYKTKREDGLIRHEVFFRT